MTKKYISGLLLILAFGLTNCNNGQTTAGNGSVPDAKAEFARLNNFLKQYEEPSQTFKIPADKPAKVTGRQGTIISVNPSDLVTENGQAMGKSIEVELKELTNQEQLLRANTQTMSDGRLLVSGGAYFINMTSDGQQLKLKEGKKLSVVFPKFTSKPMTLFYGQRDSLGQINWQQAEQKFENRPAPADNKRVTEDSAKSINEIDAIFDYVDRGSKRPLTKEEKKAMAEERENAALADKLYKAINLEQFGWINCDRFYDIPDKTTLQYVFNDKDSVASANIYLVFKDSNSLMHNLYFSDGSKMPLEFQNVPVGVHTRLIVFSIRNGKVYAYKSDLTIKANEKIQLNLKETNEKQIEKLFQAVGQR